MRSTFARRVLTTLAAVGIAFGGVTATLHSAPEAHAAPIGSNPVHGVLVATSQPGPHRVPGHYFTSPTPPRVQQNARPTAVFGPSTPIFIGNSICTVAVAGYDKFGNKVAITAGHCGVVGTEVRSMDAPEAGVVGRVATSGVFDYSVIKLRDDVRVTRHYGRANITRLGGAIPATGQNICKTGIATGTKCGPTLALSGSAFFSHICASFGDSGAPVYSNGRLLGILNGGLSPLPSCTTPLQGPLHSPTIATAWDPIAADLNVINGVGAGFRLP